MRQPDHRPLCPKPGGPVPQGEPAIPPAPPAGSGLRLAPARQRHRPQRGAGAPTSSAQALRRAGREARGSGGDKPEPGGLPGDRRERRSSAWRPSMSPSPGARARSAESCQPSTPRASPATSRLFQAVGLPAGVGRRPLPQPTCQGRSAVTPGGDSGGGRETRSLMSQVALGEQTDTDEARTALSAV